MPVADLRAVLVAPDAFKGTLSAADVARPIAQGLIAAGCPPPDLCPVADGGEGTMEVLRAALGGSTAATKVSDPLGRPVGAAFALLKDGKTAVVEVAEASGLQLVFDHERDAEAASSRGTGELIVAAIEAGARTILVAAGGSASTDGGAGAIAAIDEAGGLDGASLVVLCDVRTPFERAAVTYAPQKGADPATVKRLRERLESLAATLPRDPRGVSFSGAAGGLAGGLWARFGARLEAGAPYVLQALGFDARMRAARAVVVGEGRIDSQTLQGKVAGEIAVRARQAGVPCHAIVGSNALNTFEQRILDLQTVTEATTDAALKTAGERLAAFL